MAQLTGFLARLPNVVMLGLWSARPRREACLAGKREKNGQTDQLSSFGISTGKCILEQHGVSGTHKVALPLRGLLRFRFFVLRRVNPEGLHPAMQTAGDPAIFR